MPIRFSVYNSLGENVYTSSDYYLNEGENSVAWNTFDNKGASVAAGEYILALRIGTQVVTSIIVISR
jgi:flagellar hook assembly protein FlgD